MLEAWGSCQVSGTRWRRRRNAEVTAEWFWKVKSVGSRLVCLRAESLRRTFMSVEDELLDVPGGRAEAHGSCQ